MADFDVKEDNENNRIINLYEETDKENNFVNMK